MTEDPQVSIQDGKYAKIPIVNGSVAHSPQAEPLADARTISDCDDEGTLFTLPLLNITQVPAFDRSAFG